MQKRKSDMPITMSKSQSRGASSSRQDSDGGESTDRLKKRRIPGACDTCKRKKIRCDSAETADNRCTNCLQAGLECTHKEVTKTLGSAKGYVESLEVRLEKMDKLLGRLLPGLDVNNEIERMDQEEPNIVPGHEDEQMLAQQLESLNLDPSHSRFFGKSSQYQLVQTALRMKEDYTGLTHDSSKPEGRWKRPEYWDVPEWTASEPWNDNWHRPAEYDYPPADLMPALIDAYFNNVNPFSPLLHRPTFERSLAEGLHFLDLQFGSTLLLVCAHGAKYVNDPRVLVDGQETRLSAGWKWFNQVQPLRKSLYKKCTLYELQIYALHILYAQSGPIPQGVWVEIGYAMRSAVEVGAHRRRRSKDTDPIEDELWKRAFWVLVTIDTRLSAMSGRSSALQDECYDLDFPRECDDEYWETGFIQPDTTPSTMSFFICYLRLMNIMEHTLGLLYAIKRPKRTFHKGPLKTDEDLISELDAMMNEWMDSLPAHLRWHTKPDNSIFSSQSAFLHAAYYHLQIMIHRPFVPSTRNPKRTSYPSLAICTNSARSCCFVLESASKGDSIPLTYELAFTSAIILLLHMWSGKRSGHAPDPRRDTEDVQRCMQILHLSQERWSSAGRYLDVLSELVFTGGIPLPAGIAGLASTSGRKRTRAEIDDDSHSSHSSSSSSSPAMDHSRSFSGSRAASRASHRSSAATGTFPNFSLPMYSNELGALPIYGQFSFSDSPGTMAFPSTARGGTPLSNADIFHQGFNHPIAFDSTPSLRGIRPRDDLLGFETAFESPKSSPSVSDGSPELKLNTVALSDVRSSRDTEIQTPIAKRPHLSSRSWDAGIPSDDFASFFGNPQQSNAMDFMPLAPVAPSASMWASGSIPQSNTGFIPEDWDLYDSSVGQLRQMNPPAPPQHSHQPHLHPQHPHHPQHPQHTQHSQHSHHDFRYAGP